jgi:hypothetical protein
VNPEKAEPAVCLNCGEKLLGPYCSQCGQPFADLRRPLRELAANFFEDVLNLDSRLLRAIGPLLLRPGFLTREYLAGHRARYSPPLRLFLIVTVIFVGLTAVLPARSEFRIVTDPEQARPATSGKDVKTIVLPKRFTRAGDTALSRRLSQAAAKAQANPREFVKAIAANLPRAFFLLLPVFALLIRLVYLRQDRLYVDHLIFALHFHAFGFATLSLNTLVIRMWEPISRPLLVLLWIWFFAYLAIALRRVYGSSWPWTAVKLCVVLVLYGSIFLLAMLVLVPLTLYLF